MHTRRRRTNSGRDQTEDSNTTYSNNSYNSSSSYATTTESYSTGISSVSTPSMPTIDPNMTCRDRTNEFLSAVKSMQSRQMGNGIAGNNKRRQAIHQRSEFMTIAKKIGSDISNTFSKLEKLTILAKRKSLFDDKPVEIQELTYIIKQDINSLNKQIAQLQELVKSNHHVNGRHKQTHSNTVVFALQSKLANMSNDFKSVLEVRTENLKHQKTRREQFSHNHSVSASMPKDAMNGHVGSVLLNDEANSYNGGSDIAINMDDMERDRYQQQLHLIEENDSYIQSRANTMQNIEQTIVELGSIFTQLATMVKEQEETVQRIDSNTENTLLNVEAAHGEILKYFQSVTSNRWLMIKIFGVLLFFFVIFVVFMT